jgi:hypothetical protein
MCTLNKKVHWTSEIELEGSTYLAEERDGSKDPDLYIDDDDDDDDCDDVLKEINCDDEYWIT